MPKWWDIFTGVDSLKQENATLRQEIDSLRKEVPDHHMGIYEEYAWRPVEANPEERYRFDTAAELEARVQWYQEQPLPDFAEVVDYGREDLANLRSELNQRIEGMAPTPSPSDTKELEETSDRFYQLRELADQVDREHDRYQQEAFKHLYAKNQQAEEEAITAPLQEEIEALKSRNTELQDHVRVLEEDIEELEQENFELQESVDELTWLVEGAHGVIGQLEKQQVVAEHIISSQQKEADPVTEEMVTRMMNFARRWPQDKPLPAEEVQRAFGQVSEDMKREGHSSGLEKPEAAQRQGIAVSQRVKEASTWQQEQVKPQERVREQKEPEMA